MGRLETRVKTIAGENGAALVGIASRKRLSDAPPSGNPGYVLPSAQSIISFAIPYDPGVLEAFFRKTDWRPFNTAKKQITQRLYMIGDLLENFLRRAGFDALSLDINNNYRPEPGAQDVSEIVAMHPDFAHRYGAVAAGIGRLGWSGNLMTPQYGSAILLGTVLTSAKLVPDPVLADNPCDGCKMCVATCPVEMIHRKESVEITLAGITEKIAQKRTNNCCWIGCEGYHSLSPSRKWSNWSPYRLMSAVPAADESLDELCTHLRKADPDASPDELNPYTDYRRAFFDPDYLFLSVCAHCANVCWPAREDRIANRKLLANSGIVVLRVNGERWVAKDENDIVEMDTPFYLKVALLRQEYEAALRGQIEIEEERALILKDKMALKRFKQVVCSQQC